MKEAPERPSTRTDRRKAKTRAALIAAAQRLLAERGSLDVSIQELTDAADVGFGSFYNHFTSKEELLEAALAEAFEQHGAWLDGLLAEETDPAVVFATSLRLTARLHKTNPTMAQVLRRSADRLLAWERGVAPRALRDIKRAVAAGRFETGDPEVALACAAGALIGLMHLFAVQPRANVEKKADEMVRNVLRMFGMSEADARAVVARPLPGATKR